MQKNEPKLSIINVGTQQEHPSIPENSPYNIVNTTTLVTKSSQMIPMIKASHTTTMMMARS